ncbi:MAG: hypothetical protein ABSG30_09830 [Steroidobacteraceae bacterium]|jgi:hypothetical protein
MKHPMLMTMLLLGAVGAQETLDYTGQPMTGNDTNITQITGVVDLAQALNPNEAYQLVVPTYYSFDANQTGVLTGVPHENSTIHTSFLFSAQNGAITGWDVAVNYEYTVAASTLLAAGVLVLTSRRARI